MAFIPTSILGSANANLGEFILGVIEEAAEVTCRCSASATFLATPKLERGGSVTCSATASASWSEGYAGFRLAAVRGPRHMKPPLGARLNRSAARGLVLGSLLNERVGIESRNLVDGYVSLCASSGGAAPFCARGRDTFGDFIQFQANNQFFLYQPYDCPNQITAAVMYWNDGGSSLGFDKDVFTRQLQNFGTKPKDWRITRHDGSTTVAVRTGSSPGTETGISFSTLYTDRPVMVVLVYDGATLYAYQDGILQSSTAVNQSLFLTTGAQTAIGDITGDSDLSKIYCAYLWNRALSPAEILDLYRDPYWLLIHKPRRIVTEKSATFNYQGQVECDAKASASFTGKQISGGRMTAHGSGTLSCTGTEHYGSDTLRCDGKGTLTAISFTQRVGSMTARATATAAWTASIKFGAVTATMGAAGMAQFIATLLARTSLTCAGKATMLSEGKQPAQGSLTCSASGTASFLVGLDGVIFTCLTKGDEPTAVTHLPNFVY